MCQKFTKQHAPVQVKDCSVYRQGKPRSYDVIALQETWLLKQELGCVNNIHEKFNSFGISSVDCENDILVGRPYGGLAFLWRNELPYKCKVIQYNDNRILGLAIEIGDLSICLLNVYLPYCCKDNEEEFLMYLGKITAIVQEADTPLVCIVGDFNADFKSQFGIELEEMCKDEGLIIADAEKNQDQNIFTFINHAFGTTSWLDHCVCTEQMYEHIRDVSVLKKFVSSDHLPMSICCEFAWTSKYEDKDMPTGKKMYVDWSKASNIQIRNYTELSETYLSNIVLNRGTLQCQDPNCKISSHGNDIDSLYHDIMDCLIKAGKESIGEKHVSGYKNNLFPGWNMYVKDKHEVAREAFLEWCSSGKPRNGAVYEAMYKSRLQFKYELRSCKRNEDRIRANAMAKDLNYKDFKGFWKKIKQII